MKPTLKSIAPFAIATLLFGLTNSCEYLTGAPSPQADPDTIPSIKQGVYGTVSFWKGNFMPTYPTTSGGSITPVVRKIVVHIPTTMDFVDAVDYSTFYRAISTPEVGSTMSNSKGFFQIELPPGRYSFFIVEGSLFYASGSDGYGYLWPATVFKDSLTRLELNITYMATF
jgi:hypothetical protein